jgi:hypothetical protein
MDITMIISRQGSGESNAFVSFGKMAFNRTSGGWDRYKECDLTVALLLPVQRDIGSGLLR